MCRVATRCTAMVRAGVGISAVRGATRAITLNRTILLTPAVVTIVAAVGTIGSLMRVRGLSANKTAGRCVAINLAVSLDFATGIEKYLLI